MTNKELEKILEGIIIQGKVGLKLPSEATLMKKYQINRTTIRNTLK